MARIEDTLICDGCGIEILAAPYIVNDQHYCCKDCADGLQCSCRPEVESRPGEAAL
ncbi:MAG: hypothetical protein GX495_05435 [Chloroflexi bacterium]|jgi:hypothetical protein|nr:hypothetical protein [Chloroflexota bacterium]